MRRSQLCSSVVGLLLASAGCATRPAPDLTGFDCDSHTGVCTPRDAGSSDSDGSPSADAADAADGGDASAATVQIASPASPAYTNASITIQVAFSPEASAPASADLFDGDVKIGTVSVPFSFAWDTSGQPAVPEGPHQITARATVPGGAISSEAVTIIVDRTPPGIAGRTPSASATNVLFSDPIQVAFSEPIDPTSLPGAIALSTGAGAIASTATLATDGKTVNIAVTDRHAITLPVNVTVSVKPTVADLAGNQIGSVPTWTWNAPAWVKLPMLSGKYPEVALGPGDRPVVLSAVEQDAIGSNDFVLQLAQLGATRAWDTSVPSPQDARPAARVSSRAALVVGSDGQPVVAWPESQGSASSTVHLAKWTGTSWDKTYGQLDGVPGAGSGIFNPALAFSPAGALFLSWAEANPTVTDVFTAKWTGTSWDTSYGSLGVIGANGPVLRFGADGQPLLGFYTSITTATVARWTGTAWTQLPTYTPSDHSAALAVDSSGRPVVASISSDTSDRYVRLFFFDGTSWAEQIPAAPTGLQPRDPQLVLPADGHPVIAWTEYDMTASARVVRVSRHTGAQWDFTYGGLDGSAGANTDGSTPRLVLDSGGSPIVAWQETDGSIQSTYVWRSNH